MAFRDVLTRYLPVLARRLPPPVKQGKLEYIGPVSKRASQVGFLISLATGGAGVPQRSRVRYEVNAKDGYEENPVVYRCIRLVAEALKSMPPRAFDGEKELDDSHPLRELLENPNPRESWGDIVDSIVGHLYLAGEEFLEGVTTNVGRTRLAEIYSLRPDKCALIPGRAGFASSIDYESAAGVKRFDLPERGFLPILHIKQWNPRDHWRGLPIAAPAAGPADEYSDSVAQNRALLNNAAQPSGVLTYAPKQGEGNLDEDSFERLKQELEDFYTGTKNAGRPMILDNMDWKQMGMSPRDAMSVEQRAAAARETALALGVPPLVLGLPGDNTFSNFREANLAFYRQTVWPLAEFIADKLTRWVRPIYGAKVRVAFDRDKSPMAEEERVARWDRIDKVSVLTVNEKRKELGYEPYKAPAGVAPGDQLLVPSGLSTLEDVVLGEPDPSDAANAAYGGDPNAS